MMHKILRVKLHQQPHKIHMHQMLQAEDHHAQLTVTRSLKRLEKTPYFLTV